MNDQRRLKIKLKLKRLRKLVAAEVKENFGYSPNTTYFNGLMDEMNYWSDIAKEEYNDLWIKHINSV